MSIGSDVELGKGLPRSVCGLGEGEPGRDRRLDEEV